MVSRIEVVQKWMPFMNSLMTKGRELSNESMKESAYQMSTAISNVIELDVGVDTCDINSLTQIIESIPRVLESLKYHGSVEKHDQELFARDLSDYITEQSERFNNTCICSNR